MYKSIIILDVGKDAVEFTQNIYLEHIHSLLISILQALEYLLLCLIKVFSCRSYDWEIGSVEYTPGNLKANTTRRRADQGPRLHL